MSEFVCPIWGTPAELLGGSLQEEGVRVSSHRAGGRYRITSEAIDAHPSLTASQRALITTWLVDQRRFGERSPTLTSKGIDAILAQRPLRYNEKKERFFRAFVDAAPGGRIHWKDGFPSWLEGQGIHPQTVLALMGVESFREGHAIMLFLRDDGFLHFQDGFIEFTGKGYDYLDTLSGGSDTRQAFVAMWFDDSMKESGGSALRQQSVTLATNPSASTACITMGRSMTPSWPRSKSPGS